MPEPKKVAAIVTVYRKWSHADVIVGKVLEGYLHDGKARPNLKLVSMYVDQFPDGDMSRALARKHGFTLHDTVAGAVTRGGKSLAVVNDKHLSASWKDAKWMYDKARELFVPFMAGSSLPVTWRRPPLKLPKGCDLVEAVQVGYGPLEAYGFHALEAL